MRRVHLSIDALILHGVAHEDRRAVAAAIERELTRRLALPGIAEALAEVGHVDRLPAARVELAGRKPADIGSAAGRGIARALAPGRVGR